MNKNDIKKLINRVRPVKIFIFLDKSSLVKSLKFSKTTHVSNFLGVKNFLEVIKDNKYKISF